MPSTDKYSWFFTSILIILVHFNVLCVILKIKLVMIKSKFLWQGELMKVRK